MGPRQNGLAERSMGSVKVDAQSIMADESLRPGQDVPTVATIARHHTPHTIAGIPPALAMTGRADRRVDVMR